MSSPERSRYDGHQAVDQLHCSDGEEKYPPEVEEQVKFLIPNICWENTCKMDFILASRPIRMLNATRHYGKCLGQNLNYCSEK